MPSPSSSLSFAVRWRVVFRYLGQLCVVFSVLALPPMCVALLFGDFNRAARYGVLIATLLACGLAGSRLRAPRVQRNEAIVVSALAFLLAPLFLGPVLAGERPFIDVWFEIVSAVTTTGLSTLGSVSDQPRSFLFARSWMQWYGGLGVVILFQAMLAGSGLVARQFGGAPRRERNLAGTTRVYARIITIVYCILTIAAVAVLSVSGLDAFEAVTHALSAISTGGFATADDSLAGLHWVAQLAVVGVCLAGAVSLGLYNKAWRHGWGEIARDVQLRALLAATITVVGALAATLIAIDGLGWRAALHHATIMGLSAQTTAGFSSLPVSETSSLAQLLLIVAMFVGGAVGSTAGGVKILRMLVVLQLIRAMIHRLSMPPHAVLVPRLGDQRLEADEVESMLLLVVLFALVILLSWLPFVAYGHAPLAALFEVVSATATVGLSAGLCGPDLETPLKVVLCIDMLLGRLEIVAFLVLFYPRTWVGRRRGETEEG